MKIIKVRFQMGTYPVVPGCPVDVDIFFFSVHFLKIIFDNDTKEQSITAIRSVYNAA